MNVRPISFTGPMVKALLDGRKTQTRRVLKNVPLRGAEHDARWNPHVLRPGGACPNEWTFWDGPSHGPSLYHSERIRFEPGDLLYVRECWRCFHQLDGTKPRDMPQDSFVQYEASGPVFDEGVSGRFRADIHMPRWASRLTLKVTDVRVERVQEISEADAKAEGVSRSASRRNFEALWDSINAARGFGWEANPWVVAISFTVIRQNVDEYLNAMKAQNAA